MKTLEEEEMTHGIICGGGLARKTDWVRKKS